MAPNVGLITALGLPCTGKSTVMSELAALSGLPMFLEPEEHVWPAAVMDRDECGHFTGLMWFRSIRVPMLYQADRLARAGSCVIVDSYYDKALRCYLGKPGMEWLIHPGDRYFDVARQIADHDWHSLPDARCVVTFELDYAAWRTLLAARNRTLDRDPAVIASYTTQQYFIEAAQRLAAERGITHVRFTPPLSTPSEAAQHLRLQLIEEGVLP
ncbi:hypothetical protein AB4305_32315 [Nocardia sp. 2YAB30]|uniref:hypothetical protein n=1 Tax=Nocardia sp. 2YAB30 TaxID=3233022 RepID=UPI003F9AA5BB